MCALWYYDDDETDWASPADCGWGDVAHSDEGAVYLSEFEWGRQIAEYKREASSDPDKYYSMGEANEITLLQYLERVPTIGFWTQQMIRTTTVITPHSMSWSTTSKTTLR